MPYDDGFFASAPASSSTATGTSSSDVGRILDAAKSAFQQLPGHIVQAVTAEISNAVNQAAQPAVTAVAGRKLGAELPYLAIGFVVAWLVFK